MNVVSIAYLTGISGSGKGYIAEQLRRDVEVLSVDELYRPTANQLAREDTRPRDDWGRWDEHLRTLDVVSTFTQLIPALWSNITANRPILAEGLLLAHEKWRQAFRDALVRHGITIGDERLFWIDPPAEVVFGFRQQRGRSNQKDETVEVVTMHRNWLHERVDANAYHCFKDAEKTVLAIRKYFHLKGRRMDEKRG